VGIDDEQSLDSMFKSFNLTNVNWLDLFEWSLALKSALLMASVVGILLVLVHVLLSLHLSLLLFLLLV
jgi:hypothetical protein